MKHFFRGGRGTAVGQSSVRLLADDKVTKSPCYRDLSNRPIKQTPTVYQLSSAQDLPWFYFSSTSPRSACDCAVTRLRSFIGASSQPHRSAIGAASEKGRTWHGSYSPFVEGHTQAMSCLYTGYEQETPKNGTRNIQGWHKDETRMEQETSKRETRKWRSEGGEDCFVVVPPTRKDGKVGLGDLKLPERYCKGTGKVLKSGGKGTGEVLGSYQRGTKEVLTGSRSVVALGWDRDCFGVVPTSRNDGRVVNDPYMNRLVLKGFRSLYEDFRDKVAFYLDKTKINGQRGLKCFCGFVAAKTKLEPIGERPLNYGRGDVLGGWKLFACLMIFCVFSNPDLLGTSAMAQSPHRVDTRMSRESGNNFEDVSKNNAKHADTTKVPVKIARENMSYFVSAKSKDSNRDRILRFDPNADLSKYPLLEYKAHINRISTLDVGKKVSDEIMDLPIRIVNDVNGRDSVTLRDLSKNKLLVLDFWATWCSPCLAAMRKWKELQPKYEDQVQVVGLMLDYDYRAETTIQKENWTMPQLIGPEVYLLNYYFCGTPVTGPSVWINNGLFVGVSKTRANTEKLINGFNNGEIRIVPPDETMEPIAETGS